MKDILKAFLKYIIIVVFIFIFIFIGVFLFNLMPLIRLNMNDRQIMNLAVIIAVPAFYHSAFNALIVSMFFYGVFILNYMGKYRFPAFMIPLIVSVLFAA